jgi:hypothetical protein
MYVLSKTNALCRAFRCPRLKVLPEDIEALHGANFSMPREEREAHVATDSLRAESCSIPDCVFRRDPISVPT